MLTFSLIIIQTYLGHRELYNLVKFFICHAIQLKFGNELAITVKLKIVVPFASAPEITNSNSMFPANMKILAILS